MRLRVQLDNPVRVEYSDLDRASLDAAAKASLSTLDLVAKSTHRPGDGERARAPRDIQPKPKEKGTPDDTPGKPFLSGLRHVDYEWLGTRDRSLWNWIRVKNPRNQPRRTWRSAIYTQDISNPTTYRSIRLFAFGKPALLWNSRGNGSADRGSEQVQTSRAGRSRRCASPQRAARIRGSVGADRPVRGQGTD